MDKIDKKTIQDIKDYVKSLNKPDNEIYQENELLIQSCFHKAMEIIEENSKLRNSTSIIPNTIIEHQFIPEIRLNYTSSVTKCGVCGKERYKHFY